MSEITETGALKTVVQVDEVAPVEVTPEIVRRRLPRIEYVGGWLIDFAPGVEWPEVDVHAPEERYYVLSGEVIEGDERHGPVRTWHRAAATGPASRGGRGCSGSPCCPVDPHGSAGARRIGGAVVGERVHRAHRSH